MIDIAKMQNAKRIIECLANGIHPVTGEILKDTVFDEPEVIRCLFFIKEVLQEEIENPQKGKKEEFSADSLQLENVLQDEPIALSPFVKKIKDANGGVGPNAKKIWELLTDRGFLCEGTNLNGNKTRLPTELGLQSGLTRSERQTAMGKSFYVVEYDRTGQELLLECIKEIYS